ncbi:MAG TPA: ParB/RepB/Spo0J family partition protein [Verrucomicrobiae bacterium]|jgi:ParB family chromosome partitioning protein
MAKPVLGRGLSALLGATGSPVRAENAPQPAPPAASEGGEQVRRVPVARVRPCPLQPRKDFSQESLQELADSIKEQGIVQPLIVRPKGDGFEIIAGERRWRAAQLAGLSEVPVIARQADDRAVLEMALIENLQRENLNAIEEAQGYAQLIGQFQLTQEQAALKVGKSRAVVANSLRLLKLPPPVQAFVREGRLSVGHAKVILGLALPQEQELAADRILKKSLNVRQTEELIGALQKTADVKNGRDARPAAPLPDAHLAAVRNKIQERFGTKASVRYHRGQGAIEIKFFSDGDLERILKVAGIEMD